MPTPPSSIQSLATRPGTPSISLLLERVYDELREAARHRLRRSPGRHTLSPTDLVHEVYLKLKQGEGRDYESHRHFIQTAARTMQSILVDRARARMTAKRGGGAALQEIDVDARHLDRSPTEILAIDEALQAFSEESPRASRVVRMRVFLGLTEAEIADVLDVTERTVRRDWAFARAWLADHMGHARSAEHG